MKGRKNDRIIQSDHLPSAVFGDAGQVPISLNQWGPIFADAPNNQMPTGYVSQ